VRLFAAGEPAHELLHHRHPHRAADEDDFMQVWGLQLSIGQGALEWADTTLQESFRELLEPCARELQL
jgi:hypothetical protein